MKFARTAFNPKCPDKIIDYYRDFVMNPNNNRKCILFDKVVYEFLYNSKFMDYVKDEIKSIPLRVATAVVIIVRKK